jgi:hypothetical protein
LKQHENDAQKCFQGVYAEIALLRLGVAMRVYHRSWTCVEQQIVLLDRQQLAFDATRAGR